MGSNSEIARLVYYQEDLLGQGCQGTKVYGGQFGKIHVAVKRILTSNHELGEREIVGLQQCRHPRIVDLYQILREDQFLILVLERCASTLETHCHGKYGGPVIEVSQGIKQMLEGIAYIHRCNFVHRDVKPSNILITYSGDLKIADFGFSKPMTGANTFSISDAGKGTFGWMAPELLRVLEDAESSKNLGTVTATATPAIDIFPLGCVFFYFLTKGQHPFGSTYMRNQNILMGKPNLTQLSSKNLYRSLIKHMIDADPAKRPDLNRVLEGPLFNVNISSDELLQSKTKFNTLVKSLRNKFMVNKEAKAKPTVVSSLNYTGSLQVKDARFSPQRKAIFDASWSPLQVVDEHDLSLNVTPTHPPQAFTFPTVRAKASSSSDALVKTDVVVNTRKEKRTIAQRKKFTSEIYESEAHRRPHEREHSKSMTNLFGAFEQSSFHSNHSVHTLASSSASTLGSILFLCDQSEGNEEIL